MVIADVARGEIWWADLPEPRGSEPGFPRPVLVVQSAPFNRSRLRTVIAAGIKTNLQSAAAPGNVLITVASSGLPRDCVVNVSQLITLDRMFLRERVGVLSQRSMAAVEAGLRLVLAL